MHPLEQLAEARIAEAAARGEFENLPGAGRPLRLDDDAAVPETLRVAYRVLKNAGCVPPEVAARGEALTLERLLRCARDGDERARLNRRLQLLRTRLEARPGATPAQVWAEYDERIAAGR